ncbi:MAG: histone deacetylase family protein [Patescibacteria group bacterium]
MVEGKFYFSHEHEQHTGFTDSEGNDWDVPGRLEKIVSWIARRYGENYLNVLQEINESDFIDIIRRVHEAEMIEELKQTSLRAKDGEALITSFDSDKETSVTPVSRHTYKSALAAVKCSLSAAEMLKSSRSNLAVALSRPPGHHAGKNYYHGFCYMNNIAVAAESLKEDGERVAILDIDAHHGDGTQQIFQDDSSVFYSSLHADPNLVLPHTGKSDEIGNDGSILNLPYSIGISTEEYLTLLNFSLKHIQMFDPQYLLISAGFDTHKREFESMGLPPVTQLDSPDYEEIGRMIGSLSLPTGVVLEGGYNQTALSEALMNFTIGLENSLKTKPCFDFFALK